MWCRGAAKSMKPGLSAKRTRTDRHHEDHPGSSLPGSAMDDQQPHIPRRKRSRPSDQIRPLEVLAAANAAARAAAAARVAYEAHVNQDDYTSDPLSSLAAAAAAESESDAELAKRTHNEDERRHRSSQGQPLQAQRGSSSSVDLTPAGPFEPTVRGLPGMYCAVLCYAVLSLLSLLRQRSSTTSS